MTAPTHISGRDFNKRASAIKREVQDGSGPVVITDHGTPVAVLLSWEDYRKTQPLGAPLTKLLAAPETDNMELPIDRDGTPHSPIEL